MPYSFATARLHTMLVEHVGVSRDGLDEKPITSFGSVAS
jgi:hypothetical protein